MNCIVDGVSVAVSADDQTGITTEWAANAAAIASTVYREQRRIAYGCLGDQLDLLWHSIDQGLPLDKNNPFYTFIAGVKIANPKPS